MRELIVAEARKLIGVPFAHQGRNREVAIDCIGLLVSVAKVLAIPHQDSLDYKRHPKKESLPKGLRGAGLIELEDASTAGPGDVLTFFVMRQRFPYPRHVGILTELPDGRTGLIHTWSEVGGVVEHGFARPWTDNIAGAWRFPGVTD